MTVSLLKKIVSFLSKRCFIGRNETVFRSILPFFPYRVSPFTRRISRLSLEYLIEMGVG